MVTRGDLGWFPNSLTPSLRRMRMRRGLKEESGRWRRRARRTRRRTRTRRRRRTRMRTLAMRALWLEPLLTRTILTATVRKSGTTPWCP